MDGQKNSTTANPNARGDRGPQESSRRQGARFGFMRRADWDFFTSGSGVKTGYLENISEHGCLLRTTDPIEHRRWIRLVVKEPKTGFLFTAVGRVLRREDRLESWQGGENEWAVTLHRYGVEFVHPLNAVVLEQIASGCTRCAHCGGAPAGIADLHSSDTYYCVLCHLRDACQNLLPQVPDASERSADLANDQQLA